MQSEPIGRLKGKDRIAASWKAAGRTRTSNGRIRTNSERSFAEMWPFGTVMDHDTMFVGFSSDQKCFVDMLRNMAGLSDGVRDALTYFTRALTGSYYFIRVAPGPGPLAAVISSNPIGLRVCPVQDCEKCQLSTVWCLESHVRVAPGSDDLRCNEFRASRLKNLSFGGAVGYLKG
jgi:hypothetical protein